jgi:hypothetical protein
MVWSKFKRALAAAAVVGGGLGGLAWSQQHIAPVPAPAQGQPAERIMTVHEDGHALRCRVVQTWRMEDGTMAYQLQVIDSGEMLTIVEEGPITTVPGPNPGSKIRALQMKIFHWGRGRTAPDGAPVPPLTAIPPSGIVEERIVSQGPEQIISVTEGEGVVQGRTSRPGIFKRPLLGRGGSGSLITLPSATQEIVTRPDMLEGDPGALTPQIAEVQSGPVTADLAQQGTWSRAPFSTARPIPQTSDPSFAAGGLSRTTKEKPVVEAKRFDWRTMWGKSPQTKTQVPGQSTVEQANILPDQQMTSPDRLPLGAQSVLAAQNGLPTRTSYIPVPVVTVPKPYRPPMPPEPKLPEAPQLNQFLNAFSPPQPKAPANPPPGQQGIVPNQIPAAQTGYLPPPMQQQMMRPPMMPQQYGQPVGMVNPQLPPGAIPYVPVTGRPAAYMNHPTTYKGPQPPNPFMGAGNMPAMPPGAYAPGSPMMNPAAYPPPMLPPQYPSMPPQTMSQTPPQAETIAQLIGVLRDSPYPAQREWAANSLASFDCKSQPMVLQALMTAAQQDPAATVRAGCVHQLGRMSPAPEPVLATLKALKTDADPRVRYEVEQAMARVAPGQATVSSPQVLPASKIGN